MKAMKTKRMNVRWICDNIHWIEIRESILMRMIFSIYSENEIFLLLIACSEKVNFSKLVLDFLVKFIWEISNHLIDSCEIEIKMIIVRFVIKIMNRVEMMIETRMREFLLCQMQLKIMLWLIQIKKRMMFETRRNWFFLIVFHFANIF